MFWRLGGSRKFWIIGQGQNKHTLTVVGVLWNSCSLVHAHLSVFLSVQVEQPKNDLDLDQDADLAYNSLKVRLSEDRLP